MSFQSAAERSSVILVAWQLLMFWLAGVAAVVVGEAQTVEYLERSADDEQAVWGPELTVQILEEVSEFEVEVIELEAWRLQVYWMV